MNRLKKEFRKHELKLESDYDMLPFFINGKSIFDRGYIFIDAIVVNSETATLYRYLNIGVEVFTIQRDGTVAYNFR